jgi:hypothetical protein
VKAFVNKPYDLVHLYATIRGALERRAAVQHGNNLVSVHLGLLVTRLMLHFPFISASFPAPMPLGSFRAN